jgi:hypothetical protein
MTGRQHVQKEKYKQGRENVEAKLGLRNEIEEVTKKHWNTELRWVVKM